jgi:hypothetical protein
MSLCVKSETDEILVLTLPIVTNIFYTNDVFQKKRGVYETINANLLEVYGGEKWDKSWETYHRFKELG